MLTALIIDDNVEFIEIFKEQISRLKLSIKLVASATSAIDGFKAINQLHPDLLFLDIEMPGMNGIEIARTFPKRNFNIIFISAYDRFAIDAIREEAADYLLKPVDDQELIKAVEKVQNSEYYKPATVHGTVHKLAISSSDGVIFLEIASIVRCEADNVYTTLFTSDHQKFVSSKPIGDYEIILHPFGFVRTHRSHLVNVQHLKKYTRGEPGVLLMDDNSLVPVSKTGRENLHKVIHF